MRAITTGVGHQQGHIELGYTLAVWVVLLAYFLMNYLSDGAPVDLWLGWPWWGQLMSIAGVVLVIALGGLLEKARRWDKS